MTYASIILSAATKAKVSGTLLLAICTYETNLTNVTVYHDGGSPSYGICQVKFETAKMLGFRGRSRDLINPSENAKWAAKYLKFQEERYGTNDWCKLAAAYNAGTFTESKKQVGKPRNLKYVRRVQAKLPEELRSMLSCEAQ